MKPRLCLLGQPRLEQDGQVVLLPLDKVLWLLVLVVFSADWVRRVDVANLLWDDGDTNLVSKRMRQLLYRAKNLGLAAGLEVQTQRLRWVGSSDLLEWREALQNADDATAFALARGGLLEGLEVTDSEFAAWLELERQSFLVQHQQSALRLAVSLESQGLFEQAFVVLERLVNLLPLEQTLVLEGLRLARLAGLVRRGLDLFEGHQKELALLEEVPNSEIVLAVQQLEGAVSESAPVAQRHLPRLLNPLFGRELEVQTIQTWLIEGGRLLSVVGVGGIGKTSLALEALRDTSAVFVPLAGFTGKSLISSVAAALGVVLSGQSDAATELLAWLQRKPTRVLLLDNIEQCLDATRDFLRLIAPTAWRVLLTSRQKLALRDEQILELEGLALPADQTDFACASARLFIAAARRAVPRWQLAITEGQALVRLCRLLAGTPLALELAAAWLRVLPLSEVTTEVERNLDFLEGGLLDLPAQQDGLRAVFTHSFALLSVSQQQALARLAIFRGGFTRAAALEVTQVSHRDLLGLFDASLLRRDTSTDRWLLHELIRQYAEEHLRANLLEWQVVAEAHAKFYLRLARETPAHLLLEDVDNFRAVLTWSLSGEEAAQALELTILLRAFWSGRGLVQEAIAWLTTALDLYLPTDELAVRGRMVFAEFLQTQGQSAAAQAQLGVALQQSQVLLRSDLEALCLTVFARIDHRISQYESAMQHCQMAMQIAGQDIPSQAAALRWLGRAEIFQGDLDDATKHTEAALQMYRQLNDHEAIAHCLNSLALIAIERKDFAVARACFLEALALHQRYQEKHGQALNLTGMGWLEMLVGNLEAAQVYTLQSLEMQIELGHVWEALNAQLNLGHIAYRLNQLLQAKQYYHKVLRQAADIQAISLQLEALVGLAYVHQSEPIFAAELLGVALGHSQTNNEIVSFAQDIVGQLTKLLSANYQIALQRGSTRGLEATQTWLLTEVARV